MLALFGSVNDTTVETGVYDHAFSVQQSNQHQSLSVHLKEPNAGKAHAEEVLQATTRSFIPRCCKKRATAVENRAMASGDFEPYGTCAVSPK
jgi:hypothetical protein